MNRYSTHRISYIDAATSNAEVVTVDYVGFPATVVEGYNPATGMITIITELTREEKTDAP